MENGRCRLHGGLTPKGENWHRPRWPNSDAPTWKLDKKLDELDRRRKKLAKRLAAMTPDELALYRKRSLAARPGTPSERAQRRQADYVRELFARTRDQNPEPAPELIALNDLIRRLKLRLAELQQEGLDHDQPNT